MLDDELRNGARGVELAGIARGLEVLEELLVDVAEHVAIIGGVEVDAVDLVDDLPHQRAVLHVVVRVLEGGADQRGEFIPNSDAERLELRQELDIHEIQKLLSGHSFFVSRPLRPTQVIG